MMRPLAVAVGLALSTALPVRADGPVLLELFTSEGCSSCPPADALLARLSDRPIAGIPVVALGEHVDTWDDLGWRDPFSSALFTARHHAYARRLGARSAYTPQVVANGRAQALGSDERAVRAAIAAATREPRGLLSARVVHVDSAGAVLALEAEWPAATPADVLVALVQDRASTRVSRGENAGRTLAHVAVARALVRAGGGVGRFSGQVAVARSWAPEATRAVAFVQEPDGGPIHAVATVALAPAGRATGP
jgi:hypothetical protein